METNKEFSPIKVKDMDVKNMRERGYIGVYLYDIHSVILMFETEPTEEQVVEAIERYFNAHAFRGSAKFSRYVKHEVVDINDWKSDTKNEEKYKEFHIKVDFICDEVDKEENFNFIKREKKFDKWVDEVVAQDENATTHKFATKGSLGFESDEDIV